MRRGDLVTIVGDYDSPRPVLVIQSEAFDLHPSVVVLPLTAELVNTPLFRVPVPADQLTGLLKIAHIMVDKPTTIPRAKLGLRIGQIDAPTQQAVDAALRGFLDLSV
jgi:mRNA interferase MazF